MPIGAKLKRRESGLHIADTRIRLDNSKQKLENQHLAKQLAEVTEMVQNKKYRAQADAKHDIDNARTKATTVFEMAAIINKMKGQSKFTAPDVVPQSDADLREEYTVAMPMMGFHRQADPFSHSQVQAAAVEKTQRKPSTKRRPLTAGARQGRSYLELAVDGSGSSSGGPRRASSRPKTAHAAANSSSAVGGGSAAAAPGGRSFQSLRDMVYLDSLVKNKASRRHEDGRLARQEEQRRYEVELQARINTFYAKLDDFIARTRKARESRPVYSALLLWDV